MKHMSALLRPHALFVAAALAAPLVLAAPGSTPLLLEGEGPYFQLTLPASAHTLAKDPALSDLRVRNADGQPLPWAWQDENIATPTTRTHTVPLFPLPTHAQDSTLSLRIRSDGSLNWKHQATLATTQTDWIVDAHVATGNLLQLHLKLAPQSQGLFPLSVEGSDDLVHWHTVASNVAVLHINNAGKNLKQDTIDLEGARARYLRLHWLLPTQVPHLQSAELESFEQTVPPAPVLQWTEAWAPQRCDVSSCTWDLPAGLPMDALRVELAQTNTVAALRILGESPTTSDVQERHRYRHPLHSLRHRERLNASNGSGLERSLLADAVVWRILPAGLPENSTPPLMLDGSHHTQLRIEAHQAISEWGSTPPHIRIGTRGRTIAFLARGSQPLNLAWDQGKPEGAAVSSTILMPIGKPEKIGTAHVNLPSVRQPAATTAIAPPATTNSNPSANTADHKPWLWAVLGLSLLLLASMAFSLLKQLKTKD